MANLERKEKKKYGKVERKLFLKICNPAPLPRRPIWNNESIYNAGKSIFTFIYGFEQPGVIIRELYNQEESICLLILKKI